MSDIVATYRRRALVANDLLRYIAEHGRHFFGHEGRVSRFEVDDRGRIWYVDKYSEHRHYCHGRYALTSRHFSEGGTLRSICLALRDYIRTGKPIPSYHLGPWDEMFCGGDVWGYGKPQMADTREVARALGLVATREMPGVRS